VCKKMLLGVFASDEDVLAATRAARQAGYTIHDVLTPYAVHDLNDAMGLKPSRLTWACMACSVAGLSLAAFAQLWTGSIDWPLNVGGKPFTPLPAYLPVMFEVTVLMGGTGVVLALLILAKLYPCKREWLPVKEATNNRFVVALEASSPFDPAAVEQLWERFGLIEVKTLPDASTCQSR